VCGGALSHSTDALCTFCGARDPARSDAVDRAHEYRDDHFAVMRKADAENKRADLWTRAPGLFDESGPLAAIIGAVSLVTSFIVVSGRFLLSYLVDLPPEELRRYIAGLGLVIGFLGLPAAIFVYVTWQEWRGRDHAPRTTAVRASRLSCPHCGAPNVAKAGQPSHTCSHCRGALVPSRVAIAAALETAQEDLRLARIERHRAERVGMLGMSHASRGNAAIGSILLGVASVPAIAVLSAVVYLGATGRFPPGIQVILWILMTLGVVGVGGAGAHFFWQRHRRRRAWQEALEDLAFQFGGVVSTRLDDLVTWLNRYWAGLYEPRYLASGRRSGAVLVEAFGYQAAVALKLDRNRADAYVRVLLAAWVPGPSEGGDAPQIDPRARATKRWLEAAGFRVRFEEAGILAVAQPAVLRLLRKSPGQLHQLAPVIGHLARLAGEVGATPAAAAT